MIDFDSICNDVYEAQRKSGETDLVAYYNQIQDYVVVATRDVALGIFQHEDANPEIFEALNQPLEKPEGATVAFYLVTRVPGHLYVEQKVMIREVPRSFN